MWEKFNVFYLPFLTQYMVKYPQLVFRSSQGISGASVSGSADSSVSSSSFSSYCCLLHWLLVGAEDVVSGEVITIDAIIVGVGCF